MATTQVIEICTECEEECVLGVNATFKNGKVLCDECSGTFRAVNGFAFQEFVCTGTDPIRCEDINCPVHGRV